MTTGTTNSTPTGRTRPAASPASAAHHHRPVRAARKVTTAAQQQGGVGVAQHQRVGRGGQRQQPHRAPGQGGVAEVVAHQHHQCGHGGQGAQVGDDQQRRADADAGDPAERPGRHREGREEAYRLQAGAPRTRGRRSTGTSRRPRPAGPGGPAGGPRRCRVAPCPPAGGRAPG